MSAVTEAVEICSSLKRWLLEDAYPLWWTQGADHERGGFHERLRLDGTPTGEARRARLHPRQMYAYSISDELGWSGAHEQAVRHGLDYFRTRYFRPDGLVRTVVAADGSIVDDRAVLYDQAFALLGLASAYDTFDDDALRDDARALHEHLHAQLENPYGGFDESNPRQLPLLSNSHMHLFESALAWMDLDHDARWQRMAGDIVELALSRFIDPHSGLLREFFDAQWNPVEGDEGRVVEPGHQFEWGWLLLRWVERTGEGRAREPALRMIQFGENLGVDQSRGVAITSLLSDGSVRDPLARLWPQTERLKAACIAAETTRQEEYWTMAVAAARGLQKYLDPSLRGLWRDKMNADGSFVEEPAPASSFYHIACAIAEFDHTLARNA